jgi:hypothetical protein
MKGREGESGRAWRKAVSSHAASGRTRPGTYRGGQRFLLVCPELSYCRLRVLFWLTTGLFAPSCVRASFLRA